MRLAGGEWLVSFTTRADPGEWFDSLRGKDVSIDIKRASKARSRDANAFCWALCSDIGKALTPPVDKAEIYRQAIRAVGVYTDVTVCIWDVDTIIGRWSTHGDGWVADVIDDAGIGKKRLHLYYGSSTYTRDEMRVLLDWLTDQAEQMQIPLRLSREEEERLLAQWGKASCKQTAPASSVAG
jgi:hypothetical protein